MKCDAAQTNAVFLSRLKELEFIIVSIVENSKKNEGKLLLKF